LQRLTTWLGTAPAGALSVSDEIAVELAVCLYQKLLKNELKPSEAAQFKLILMSFGMFPSHKTVNTPIGSSEVPKSDVQSKADEILKRLCKR
jgi:hypothetical protein